MLVSIIEGSLDHAAQLAGFQAVHPRRHWSAGGLDVNYAKRALTALLDKAPSWQQTAVDKNWPTFAGAMSRCKVAPVAFEPDVPLWAEPAVLPKAPATDSSYPSPRVAETKNELLSYHPIVVGDLVLVDTQNEMRAYDLRTGKPAWGNDPVIYRPGEPVSDARTARPARWESRFTLMEYAGLLYARLGDPLTTRPEDNSIYHQPSYLVCLDLGGEGRLMFPPIRLADKWAFEGTPVTDGRRMYVGVRHGARAAVARRLLRRTHGPAAVAAIRRQRRDASPRPIGRCTHNLLTLVDGVVYVNTNLGGGRCGIGRERPATMDRALSARRRVT